MERNRKILPMHQVFADGVAPTHVSPDVALGIVLVEEVILTFVKDRPIRVVHEILWRRDVVLRTPRLIVRGGLSQGETRGECEACNLDQFSQRGKAWIVHGLLPSYAKGKRDGDGQECPFHTGSSEDGLWWIGPAGEVDDDGPGTDFNAVRDGYISITPIHVDLTRFQAIEKVSSWVRSLSLDLESVA